MCVWAVFTDKDELSKLEQAVRAYANADEVLLVNAGALKEHIRAIKPYELVVISSNVRLRPWQMRKLDRRGARIVRLGPKYSRPV